MRSLAAIILLLEAASIANAFQSFGCRQGISYARTPATRRSELREASEPKEEQAGDEEITPNDDPFGEMKDLGETKRRGTHYTFGNGKGSGYNDYYAKEYGKAKHDELEDFINNPHGSTLRKQFDYYLETPPGVPNDNRKLLRHQAIEYGKAKHDQLDDFINNPHGRGWKQFDYTIETPAASPNNRNNNRARRGRVSRQDEEDFINNPYGMDDHRRNPRMPAPNSEPFDLSRYERGGQRSKPDHHGEEKREPLPPFDPNRYEGDFRGMPRRPPPGPENYNGPMGMPPQGGRYDFQDGPPPPPPRNSVFPMGMPLPEGNRPWPDQNDDYERREPVEPFDPERYQRAAPGRMTPPQDDFYAEASGMGRPPPSGPSSFHDGNPMSKSERRPVNPNSKLNRSSNDDKPTTKSERRPVDPNSKPHKSSDDRNAPMPKSERRPKIPESKPLPGSVAFQRNPVADSEPKRKVNVNRKATATQRQPPTQKAQIAGKDKAVELQWEALKEVAKKINDGTIEQEMADEQLAANKSGGNSSSGMTEHQWQMLKEVAKQIEEENGAQTKVSGVTNAHFVSKQINKNNTPKPSSAATAEAASVNDDDDVMDAYFDQMTPGP